MAQGKKNHNTAAPLLEMAEEAFKSYEHVLRKGLKLQQEAAQWWSKSLQHTSPAPDWQKRLADLTSNSNATVIPAVQKQWENILALLERNNRTCVELVKKAAEAGQTAGLAESQNKWLEVWKSSMTAAGANAEALAEVNARMIDSCIDLVESNSRITNSSMAKAA